MGLFSCFMKPATLPASPAAPAAELDAAKKRSVKFAEEIENPIKDAVAMSPRAPVSQARPEKSSLAPATEAQPAQMEDVDVPAARALPDQRQKQSSGGGASLPMSPRNKGKLLTASGGLPPLSPRNGKVFIPGRQSDAAMDTGITSDSPSRWATTDVMKNLLVTVQGPAEFATSLRPYTSESCDQPVEKYIASLGKHGAGLVESVEAHPKVGYIFGVAYRLQKLASAAVVNTDNVNMLAALGQDVVRALDVAGKRNAIPSIEALDRLNQLLEDACDMVDVFGNQGWLLHMACNEHIKPIFDARHNAIVETLEEAELEVPGKTYPLPRGAYLDVNRNLRRTLKRIGRGSIVNGLKDLGTDPLAPTVREVADQLNLTAEVVVRELAALPTDVPLDAYYNRMVLRQGGAGATGPYEAIFNWYDKSERGYLTRANLHDVLADLGTFDGMKAADVEAAVQRAFTLADQDGDGRISRDEFARYYDTLTCTNARKQLRLALGLQGEEELKQIFHDFCAFGTRQAVYEMDSAHLVKLMKDCNLVGKDLGITDIDLAFARAKPKGGRKITFDGFLAVLAECAERKGVELDDLVRAVLACQGPIARATKAEAVRLHDDKSTYTGVYAKGGPKVIQKGTDLGNLVDRSDPASARKAPLRMSRNITIVEKPAERTPGTPQQAAAGPAGLSMSMRLSVGNPNRLSGAWQRRSLGVGMHGLHLSDKESPLYEMWLMWAQFGTGSTASAGAEMGVTQFIKMMRETGLLDKAFSAVNAELHFMRVKAKGSTKIGFPEFEKALQLVADSKGMSREAVEAAILDSEGPQLNNYKAA